MSDGPGHALQQALAFHRAPALAAAARLQPLPEGTTQVLRIAAGDADLLARMVEATHAPAEVLSEAAIFYVQQVLFAPGADSYRVLGVNPEAPDARIKEHYRWLVRWLHPDRNTDEWDAIYADRVNRAWQDLRLPDRRAAYDEVRPATPVAAAGPTPSNVRISAQQPAFDAPVLSSRTVQRLPLLVLGGLGSAAVLVLGLMWWAQQPQRRPTTVAAPETAAAPAPPARLAYGADPRGAEDPIESAASDAETGAPDVAAAGPAPVAAPVADAPAPEPGPAAGRGATPARATAPVAVAIAAAPVPQPAPPAPPAPPSRSVPPPAAPPAASVPRADPQVAAMPTPRPAPAPSASVAPPSPAPAPARIPAAPVNPVVAAASRAPAEPAAAARAPLAPPAPPAPPPLINDAIASDLIGRFTTAYAEGDLNRLMRLFASDARNNRGNRDIIAYDYQSLFSSSESRQLEIINPSWVRNGDTATILATFRASVVPAGKSRARRVTGDIRFDLRREDGELRIVRLRHENERG